MSLELGLLSPLLFPTFGHPGLGLVFVFELQVPQMSRNLVVVGGEGRWGGKFPRVEALHAVSLVLLSAWQVPTLLLSLHSPPNHLACKISVYCRHVRVVFKCLIALSLIWYSRIHMGQLVAGR